jgi:hypothetical protein
MTVVRLSRCRSRSSTLGPVDDLDPYRTDAQKEWNEWAEHGYSKRYQPRSMLWFGGIFFAVLAVALVAVFWLASTGRWP